MLSMRSSRNAFNAIERTSMAEAFANDTGLNDMHRYMESHLRPRLRIYYLSGGCLIRAEYGSVHRKVDLGKYLGGQEASAELYHPSPAAPVRPSLRAQKC